MLRPSSPPAAPLPAFACLLALVLGACTVDGAGGARDGSRAPDRDPAAITSTAIAPPSRSPEPSPAGTERPSPTADQSPQTGSAPGPASVPPVEPAARPGPFAIDLYREGAFVSQARADWCVPAAVLTMARLGDHATVAPTARAPAALPTQREIDRLARSLSTDRLVGAGSEPEGWAGALDVLGLGPYAVRADATREQALASAARALRLTGRPVGLLIWRGAHAWVMSGFEATADPAWTDAFTVTHVRVVDPWHPRVSSIWGAAQPPDARIAVAALADDFLPWRRPTVRYPEKDGRFVLVLPEPEAGAPVSP